MRLRKKKPTAVDAPVFSACLCCGQPHSEPAGNGGYCHYCYEHSHFIRSRQHICRIVLPRSPELQQLIDEEEVIEDRAAGERYRQDLIDFYEYRADIVRKLSDN